MAKMTEQELRGNKCGVFVGFQTLGWNDKVHMYLDAGVNEHYKLMKKSYRLLMVDCDGVNENILVDQICQFVLDAYLIRKARGEKVKLPELYIPDKPKEKKHSAKDDLYDRSDFSEEAFEANSDPVKEIIWIYNNLYIKNINKKDAPTPGAYSYLMWAQSSLVNRTDFLKTIYPKIIPSKSQIDKGSGANDDGRPNLNLIEKLLRQISRHKKEAPIL